MQLESLPGGFAVNTSDDDGAASKAEALSQIDWLRAAIESGEVTGFLACGIDSKGDGFGLGVVGDGTDLGKMHASLVKLHEVFHAGANGIVERAAQLDSFDAADAADADSQH